MLTKKHSLGVFRNSRLLLFVALIIGLSACKKNEDSQTSQSPPAAKSMAVKTPVFNTKGQQLLDPSGKTFIARGVNLRFGDDPKARLQSIHAISMTGANLVRLQLRADTSAKQLQLAMDDIVKNGMAAMPYLWEVQGKITCTAEEAHIRELTETLWLGRWKTVLQDPKYQAHLLINIANEWGKGAWDSSSADGYVSWLNTYKDLIPKFREAGYRVPLVIDAPGCGQDYKAFGQDRAKALVEADPERNVVFSVHAYQAKWSNSGRIAAGLTGIRSIGLPVIIGEFGGVRQPGFFAIEHMSLLEQTAGSRPIGWIASSWIGSEGEAKHLDMSTEAGKLALTERGKEIVDGPFGIRKTVQSVSFQQ